MRVLVLGPNGFVGRHVVSALLASGADVLGIVQPGTSAALPDAVEAMQLDLVDQPEHLRALLEHRAIDAIVNAAGRTRGDRSHLVRANVQLVAELVDALCAMPLSRRPRLIHVGSAAEYAPPLAGEPVSTRHPVDPRGPYGVTKACGTALVSDALRVGEFRGTVFRLFNPVGPGCPADSLGGAAVRRVAAAVNDSGDTVRFGDLSAMRDFVDVRDAAELFALACRHDGPLPWILNAGSGEARPGRHVVDAVIGAAGWSGTVAEGDGGSQRSAVPWHAADMTATHDALAWRPRRSIEEAAVDMWKEYAGNQAVA